MRRALLWLALLCAVLAVRPAAAQTYLVVVSGIGGEPAYQERFLVWGSALVEAAQERLGIAENHVAYFAEDPSRDPRIRDRSTKANVTAALTDLASRAEPGAQIVVVLIGHGSTVGGEARINLPGPDMRAEDFIPLLDAFATQEVVFANLSSASGDWIAVLSGARRVVVTATRSGTERDESIFGGHFVEALTEDEADTDKDGRVSVLEAFRYANAETDRVYGQQNRLRSEHAMLDDDGDGKGSHEPDGEAGDGVRARRVFLAPDPARAARAATDDPALLALYAERDSLEMAVTGLRARKNSMEAAAYEAELERMLLALARTNREIREREGREPR
jgi:hypothetical protein